MGTLWYRNTNAVTVIKGMDNKQDKRQSIFLSYVRNQPVHNAVFNHYYNSHIVTFYLTKNKMLPLTVRAFNYCFSFRLSNVMLPR